MSEKNGTPTPEEALAAARGSADLTAEGAREGGTIDFPALTAHAEHLDDVNSRFPATQEFLKSRGLTHVSQLDKRGRAELTAHLEKTLAEALKK